MKEMAASRATPSPEVHPKPSVMGAASSWRCTAIRNEPPSTRSPDIDSTSGRAAVWASIGSTDSSEDFPAELGPNTSVSGARPTRCGSGAKERSPPTVRCLISTIRSLCGR